MQPLREVVARVLRKPKVGLPYELAIAHLGIYLNRTIIQKDTHATMSTAALLTTARMWKQPKWPPTDERKEKTRSHTHNGIPVSHENEIMPFTRTWMQLQIIILRRPESERETP